jgi:hypothetical protein
LTSAEDGGDTDNELVTPKASQINAGRSGGLLAELEREMTGASGSPDAVPDGRGAPVATIPLSSYTMHNREAWATSFFESDKNHRIIK